jgi:2-haloalkanoic acid dehalogenase type II
VSDFGRFRALSFDCYGTLIDWEAGILERLRPWIGAHDLTVDDEALLELFSRIETVVQGEHHPALPYPEVLAETLHRIGTALGIATSQAEAEAFGATVGEWPAFPDSRGALVRLGRRFRLIVVSNVDRVSFATSNRLLGVVFDRVITADDVGSYKPRPAHFDALLAGLPDLGVERDQLLHVAQSMYHDHEPAASLGIPSVWIDRRAGREGTGATPRPVGGSKPRWRFTSLAEFADAADSAAANAG